MGSLKPTPESRRAAVFDSQQTTVRMESMPAPITVFQLQHERARPSLLERLERPSRLFVRSALAGFVGLFVLIFSLFGSPSSVDDRETSQLANETPMQDGDELLGSAAGVMTERPAGSASGVEPAPALADSSSRQRHALPQDGSTQGTAEAPAQDERQLRQGDVAAGVPEPAGARVDARGRRGGVESAFASKASGATATASPSTGSLGAGIEEASSPSSAARPSSSAAVEGAANLPSKKVDELDMFFEAPVQRHTGFMPEVTKDGSK